MAILDIVTLNNPILRRQTEPVKRFDNGLQQLIDDMIETMREANGVGLAAPQVNQPLRMAVIETLPKLDEEGNEVEGTRQLFVIVNPEIVWMSREIVDGLEGCLSIPGYLGEVSRHEFIRIRGQDRYGNKIRLRLGGWTARIFQHEIDHLNGILYIEKLTAPENFWTEEEYQKMFGVSEEAETEVAGESL